MIQAYNRRKQHYGHAMNYKNNMCIQYTPHFLQASVLDYGCLKEKRSDNNSAVIEKIQADKYR